MKSNGIKSLSIYEEYTDLLEILPDDEHADFYLKMVRYVFYDIEPNEFMSINQERIWKNLIRPIEISKQNAKNGLKGGAPVGNQNARKKTTEKTSEKTNDCTNEKTNTSKMSMSMLNVYVNVINYLNNKLGTKYSYKSKVTQKHIKARLDDGFTENDFYKVIDTKIADWKDTDFEKYLRPDTLFGAKFESYLNQKSKTKNTRPNWMDKEIESDKTCSHEELEEIDNLLKTINGGN